MFEFSFDDEDGDRGKKLEPFSYGFLSLRGLKMIHKNRSLEGERETERDGSLLLML
jgi:hypothetical protein